MTIAKILCSKTWKEAWNLFNLARMQGSGRWICWCKIQKVFPIEPAEASWR